MTFELLDSISQYAEKILNVTENIRDYLLLNKTEHNLKILQHVSFRYTTLWQASFVITPLAQQGPELAISYTVPTLAEFWPWAC